MTHLEDYNTDGANYQAKAVLAFLQTISDIKESWDDLNKEYLAHPKVARWENCREQGYVVMLNNNQRQLNIAFFEHRNSDQICAIKWEQLAVNTPTIATAEFGEIYKDKYDVSHSVGYAKIDEMANWIMAELTKFWIESSK